MSTAIPNKVLDALGYTYLGPDTCFRPPQVLALKANLRYLSGNGTESNPGDRVVINCAPVGTGKTLLAIATAQLYVNAQPDSPDWQIVYLVSTKSLQDQVIAECPAFYDLRGRSNYECMGAHSPSKMNCQQASAFCNQGIFCSASVASRNARSSPRLVTNYAMWLTYGLRFGSWKVPLDSITKEPLYSKFFVIMDEAHSLEDEMTNALEISLSHKAIQDACYADTAAKVLKLFPWQNPPVLPKFAKKVEWKPEELKPWIESAATALDLITQDVELIKTKIENGAALHNKLSKILDLYRNVQMLKYVYAKEWVLDIKDRTAVSIQCAVLKSKVPVLLMQNATKVLMVSATISPMLLESLGFKAQVRSLA